MPGKAPSTGIRVTQTSSSVSLNWFCEEVHWLQRHKGFLLNEHRRVELQFESVSALCLWKQWYVIGGFRLSWLYIDSVLLPDTACRDRILPSSPQSQYDIFVHKESAISDCHTPPGSGGINPFPYLLEFLSCFISFPVCGPIHSIKKIHFCEFASDIRPPPKWSMLH